MGAVTSAHLSTTRTAACTEWTTTAPSDFPTVGDGHQLLSSVNGAAARHRRQELRDEGDTRRDSGVYIGQPLSQPLVPKMLSSQFSDDEDKAC